MEADTRNNAETSRADRDVPIAALVATSRDGATLAARHRAFGQLAVRFQDMVFGCAFALLGDYEQAEDAAQESFLVAYQRLGSLREPAAFPGWLQQIVRSQCHRILRRRELLVVPSDTLADMADGGRRGEDASGGTDPQTVALRNERRRQVRAALADLPEAERMVTVLFYVREYSRAEVGQFLGISVVSVKKRLASARFRLKERLVEMVQEDLREERPSNSDAFAARLMAFTKLFSAFVTEGRSLVRSLADLSAEEDDPSFRAAIDDVNAELQSGNILSRAMAKHPAYFSPEYIAAIHVGEVNGNLEVVLFQWANGTYHKEPIANP